MSDWSLMMASEIPYPPLANPVAVVSQRFCTPYVVNLVVARKLVAITEGCFLVTDVNGNIVFRVKGSFSSIHEHCVVNDTASNAVVSLRQKVDQSLKFCSCSIFPLKIMFSVDIYVRLFIQCIF